MSSTRLMVTGGAGFLAWHVTHLLHGHGFEVELLDIADFAEAEYPEGVVFHRADVRDRDALRRVLRERRPGLIVHAAAALPLWSPRDIYDVNIAGTRNVLELGRLHGAGRVVNIGSTAVYGVPEKHPLVEDDPLVGVGPYGITKIAAENLCREFRGEGFCAPTLRPKTFIGTGRLGVFQILYDWVHSGKRIPVIGRGSNRYQLLEVEDLVRAIELCLTAPADLANADFNVGAKEFRTVREDVGALCEFAGNGARVLGTPAPLVKGILAAAEFFRQSPLYRWVYGTADKDSYVSTGKIEKALGWSPKYSNAEALIRSYQWYLEHHAELAKGGTGVTHRVAWDQKFLAFVKRFM